MKGLTISIVVIVVPVFILMSVPSLHADDTSLRCGSSLVSIGDTMYAVRGWHRQELPEAEGQEVLIKVVRSERQPIFPTSTDGRNQTSSFQRDSPDLLEPGLRVCKPTFHGLLYVLSAQILTDTIFMA